VFRGGGAVGGWGAGAGVFVLRSQFGAGLGGLAGCVEPTHTHKYNHNKKNPQTTLTNKTPGARSWSALGPRVC